MENLKGLIVILGLAIPVFAVAKGPMCAAASTIEDFTRRRNLWVAITLIAFLSHNFWVYIVVTGAILLHAQTRESSSLGMYLFLLLALPRIHSYIPGPGAIQNLFSIDYQRLLVLTVLFPAFLKLRLEPGSAPFGRLAADKLLLGYIVLTTGWMAFSSSSFTITLRYAVADLFIDAILPYYVASRSLKDLKGFRDAMAAFVIAAAVLSPILFFEFSRKWLIYASLDDALGARWGSAYMARGDSLRAVGSAGNPIVAGYIMAVAAGFMLYVKDLIPDAKMRKLAILLLLAGLLAPLSRGPWVGGVIMVMVFVATGPSPVRALLKTGLICATMIALLLITPYGATMIDHLPFVGTIDASTVEFRQTLVQASFQVFLENPWLGRHNFHESPIMEALRDGSGIIDLVNTYLIVALSRGAIGLSLFVGFFGIVVFGIYRRLRNASEKSGEPHLLGQSLLATIVGILFMLGAVSPVLAVESIYWLVAGMGVAYSRAILWEKSIPPVVEAADVRISLVGRGT